MRFPLMAALQALAARPEVPTVHGADAIQDRLTSSSRRAREELALYPADYGQGFLDPSFAATMLEESRWLLSHGFVLREVYAHRLWSQPAPVRQHLLAESAAGAEQRLAPVPTRLSVLDRRLVIVATDPENWADSAVLSEDPGVVALAMRLFEDAWRTSRSMQEKEDAQERRLLVLRALAAGDSDTAIARRLDISVRTLARVIAALQEELGASTRFQLAIRAQQTGLLDAA
ncbi:Homeodomain-like domain-containing protein [Motilibacter rhizosphaerae]|uniref:Homeodomain-like domain-containing protein n=1 Tax=Motilibacter rhizosphaerae TaxID=598652 RepID=A0A4Q7NNQ4_9ACTN|nr:helix-turn-helix domain-containing protein [Motilibacter rhizosphaerae]RZS86884.1 Homeodomain-like domain-containing protein [Motilibacter rhizosphaerae]